MIYRKKRLGQHFLTDRNIAIKIANSLININKVYNNLIEIGPGEGSLTRFLLEKYSEKLWLIEIDDELIPSLTQKFPELENRILNADFLLVNIDQIVEGQTGIIGNFPYNISSRIILKIIENRHLIPEMVGMFQREVAERITSLPGSREYGRLSVLVRAFYDVKLLFRVPPSVFSPPPKVESAVIRLIRKEEKEIYTLDRQFFSVVKAAFGQRRKTLRNALSSAGFHIGGIPEEILNKRAEMLDYLDYFGLTETIFNIKKE